MASVCQRCGVTGFEEYLIFCKSCKLYAEHRYCLDAIPKPNEEVEWSCFRCREKFPEAKVKTCSVLVHTNGKNRPIMKRTVHRSKLSRILKERRYHSLQAFTPGDTCPNVANHEDLPGVKSAHNSSSPRDDGGSDFLENSGEKIASPTITDCEQKHPQPSLSSGLSPHGLQLLESEVGKIDPGHGNNNVSEVEVDCSHPTSSLAGIGPNSGKETANPMKTDCELKHPQPDGPKHAEKDEQRVPESEVGKIDPSYGKYSDLSPGEVGFEGNNSEVEVPCSHPTSSLAGTSPNGGKNDCSENRKNDDGSPKTVSSEKNATRRRRLLMDVDSDEDNHSLHSIDYSIASALPLQRSSEVDYLSQPILPSDVPQPSQCFFPSPAWRGYFNIHGIVYGPIVAHASITVCEKVFNAVRRLPPTLVFEKLPKSDVYPPSFNHGNLTHRRVALYFLPGDPSLKHLVDKLLEELIVHKLALRMTLDEANLLVFSSLLLPLQQSWLIENEFYLWGMLRRRTTASGVAASISYGESGPGPDPILPVVEGVPR